MQGLYLYCIRTDPKASKNKQLVGKGTKKKIAKISKKSAKGFGIGIDGKSKTRSVLYKDIEAIVSPVDLKVYGSKEIAEKARGDLKWIIKHAQKHEKVIERVMKGDIGGGSVIPMSFGTIFKNSENLEKVLKKEHTRFKKLLKHLVGKQEWSVKVYAEESDLKKELKSSENKVQTQIKDTQNLPRGADYFGELEVNTILDTLVQEKIDSLSDVFFKKLSTHAVDSRQNRVLDQDFSGHNDPMVLNTAYLVDESKMHDFEGETKKLQKLNPGFIFELTGPWPPYNFV